MKKVNPTTVKPLGSIKPPKAPGPKGEIKQFPKGC